MSSGERESSLLPVVPERGSITGVTLVADDINCIAQSKKETKNILSHVGLVARPGEVLAVMGPSGSGKTTLLNILAGRARATLKPVSEMGKSSTMLSKRKKATIFAFGSIFLNGHQVGSSSMVDRSRYVMQADRLLAYLTVYETLHFAATLKLRELSRQEIDVRVKGVISELGLNGCRDVFIGGMERKGISGGEKKRVAIGLEMLDNPSLLFLDEPTSGLDSSLAFDVIKMLRNLAKGGRTIIATIHQPRSQIYQCFDKLMLLSEGRTVYLGAASEASAYMKGIGYSCPPAFNIADFLLDLLADEQQKTELEGEIVHKFRKAYSKVPSRLENTTSAASIVVSPGGTTDAAGGDSEAFAVDGRVFITAEELHRFPDLFVASEPGRELAASIARYRSMQGVLPGKVSSGMWGSVLAYIKSVLVLTHRHILNKGRDPTSTILKLGVTAVMALIMGFIYFQVEYPETDMSCTELYTILGSIAFICINMSFSSMNHVINFPELRPQINREMAARLYHSSAYYIAVNLADFLFIVLDPVLMVLVLGWLVGLIRSAGDFFMLALTGIITAWTAVGWCLVAAMYSPNSVVVGIIAPIGTIFALLTSGFFITEAAMPAFWSWFKYLSWIRYSLNTLLNHYFSDSRVVYNCLSLASDNKFDFLGWEVLLGMGFRIVAGPGLRFTNRRVGMEG